MNVRFFYENLTFAPANFMSKQNRTSLRSGSIQVGVLDDLLDHANVIADLLTLPPYAGPRHSFEAHMSQKHWENMYGEERKKKRALKRLREKKWIDDRRKGSEVVVRIHSDAIVSVLKERILSMQEILPEGELCLVSFDFPCGAKKARDRWRHLIKQYGFTLEQQSLYSINKNIDEEMRALAKVLGVERWVQVYRCTK